MRAAGWRRRAADMFAGQAPRPRGGARPRQRGGHVRRPHGPAVARDLGSAADMFVGPTGPAVTRDLGSAADMFVGPTGPAVARDLGSVPDMFVGPTAPRWRATSAAQRTSTRGELRDVFARLNDRPAGDVMQAARHVRSCARACLVPGVTSS